MKAPIKWLGNKAKHYERIEQYFPQIKGKYIEPMVGGGEVWLNSSGFKKYIIGDLNTHLTYFYRNLRESTELVFMCEQHFTNNLNTKESYIDIRKRFNTSDNYFIRSVFLKYLMEHGFRGVYRTNKKGKFNVPYGWYKNPKLRKEEMFYCHEKLQQTSVYSGDFQCYISVVNCGDVVYLDPPYVHITDSRDKVYGKTFSWDDQTRLVKFAERCKNKGATAIISNHLTEATKDLYRSATHTEVFTTQRQIKGKQTVQEILAIYKPKNV